MFRILFAVLCCMLVMSCSVTPTSSDDSPVVDKKTSNELSRLEKKVEKASRASRALDAKVKRLEQEKESLDKEKSDFSNHSISVSRQDLFGPDNKWVMEGAVDDPRIFKYSAKEGSVGLKARVGGISLFIFLSKKGKPGKRIVLCTYVHRREDRSWPSTFRHYVYQKGMVIQLDADSEVYLIKNGGDTFKKNWGGVEWDMVRFQRRISVCESGRVWDSLEEAKARVKTIQERLVEVKRKAKAAQEASENARKVLKVARKKAEKRSAEKQIIKDGASTPLPIPHSTKKEIKLREGASSGGASEKVKAAPEKASK